MWRNGRRVASVRSLHLHSAKFSHLGVRNIARVASLHIYPVKSCKAIDLQEAFVGEFGLEGDRIYMFTDTTGKFVTQRRYARLALVRATMQENEQVLRLEAPGMDTLLVPRVAGAEVDVEVWDHMLKGVDQGDKASAWIDAYLGSHGVRLLGMGDSFQRKIHPRLPGQASFADDGAVLLISQASVEDISNKSMQQWGGAAVPAANFRPNIVISLDNETERQDEKELPGESLSTLQPFDEDKWLAIQIGEVKFMVYEACSRCKMIGIDQNTAEEPKKSGPLTVLRSYRARNGNIAKSDFGQYLAQLTHGTIKVGDAVRVLDYKEQQSAAE